MAKIATKKGRVQFPIDEPAKLSKWDIYGMTSGQEASTGFWASLSGIALDKLNKIQQQTATSEFIKGKALWESKRNDFFRSLEKDQDYQNFFNRYQKDQQQWKQEILSSVTTKDAHHSLINLFTEDEPDIKDKLQNFIISKHNSAMRSDLVGSIESFVNEDNLPSAIAATEEAIQEGYINEPEAEEWLIQVLMNRNPENAMAFIEQSKHLTPGRKNQLRSSAGSAIAGIKRAQEEQKKQLQDETYRTALVDFWDGKLNDVNTVTRLLEADLLTDTQAKYLRAAILDESLPELDLKKYAEVEEAISNLRQGRITKEAAIETLYKNLDGIDKETGKSLLAKIYSVDDEAEPTNDPVAKRMLAALTELKNNNFFVGKAEAEMTDQDRVENLSLWLNYTNATEKWLKDNPTATPKQKEEYFNKLLAPEKEKAAKSHLMRIAERFREKLFTKEGWTPSRIKKRRALKETVSKKLTVEIARQYLNLAGGDRAEAEQMAKEDGYEW